MAIPALLAAAATIGILVLLARRGLGAHLSALLVRGLFLLARLLAATLLLTPLGDADSGRPVAGRLDYSGSWCFLQLVPGVVPTLQSTQPFRTLDPLRTLCA